MEPRAELAGRPTTIHLAGGAIHLLNLLWARSRAHALASIGPIAFAPALKLAQSNVSSRPSQHCRAPPARSSANSTRRGARFFDSIWTPPTVVIVVLLWARTHTPNVRSHLEKSRPPPPPELSPLV